MAKWTYQSFPFGTFIPGINCSPGSFILYLWELALIVLFTVGLTTDTDYGLATVILPWVGAGVNLIIFLSAVFSTPSWRYKPANAANTAEEAIAFSTRKVEMAHFALGTLVHVVLTIAAAIFQGKYSPTYPIVMSAEPLLWQLRNNLYLLITLSLMIPLATVTNTNALVYLGFKKPVSNTSSNVRLLAK